MTQRWDDSSNHRTPASDPITLIGAVRRLWAGRPNFVEREPNQVRVVFYDLVPRASVTLPLFDNDRRNEEVAMAVDGICGRYGKNAVELASVFFQDHGKREAIAFAKVTDDGREERNEEKYDIATI